MAVEEVPIDFRQPPDHHPDTLRGDTLRPSGELRSGAIFYQHLGVVVVIY